MLLLPGAVGTPAALAVAVKVNVAAAIGGATGGVSSAVAGGNPAQGIVTGAATAAATAPIAAQNVVGKAIAAAAANVAAQKATTGEVNFAQTAVVAITAGASATVVGAVQAGTGTAPSPALGPTITGGVGVMRVNVKKQINDDLAK